VFVVGAGADTQDKVRCVVQVSNLGNVRLTSLNVEGVDTGCALAGTLAVGAHINCTATRYDDVQWIGLTTMALLAA
jgi:hypothetical protein